MMILTKPEKAEDLYPLFKQILIEQHKPGPADRWGMVTFAGKNFCLKLNGEYKTDSKCVTIDIEHPDAYFLKKFNTDDQYYKTIYLDRFIIMNFCKDKKGRKSEWRKPIYQHE